MSLTNGLQNAISFSRGLGNTSWEYISHLLGKGFEKSNAGHDSNM